MEGAIGVATHHDGMSGTERQDVANDYSQRISEGHFEVCAHDANAPTKHQHAKLLCPTHPPPFSPCLRRSRPAWPWR